LRLFSFHILCLVVGPLLCSPVARGYLLRNMLVPSLRAHVVIATYHLVLSLVSFGESSSFPSDGSSGQMATQGPIDTNWPQCLGGCVGRDSACSEETGHHALRTQGGRHYLVLRTFASLARSRLALSLLVSRPPHDTLLAGAIAPHGAPLAGAIALVAGAIKNPRTLWGYLRRARCTVK
jgi:hypothetical protein